MELVDLHPVTREPLPSRARRRVRGLAGGYHVTATRRRASILRRGLVARKPVDPGSNYEGESFLRDQPLGVYLEREWHGYACWGRCDQWDAWWVELAEDDVVVPDPKVSGAVIVLGDVPPARLSRICEGAAGRVDYSDAGRDLVWEAVEREERKQAESEWFTTRERQRRARSNFLSRAYAAETQLSPAGGNMFETYNYRAQASAGLEMPF